MNSTFGLICHGGAGAIEDKALAAESLRAALEEGYRLLKASASAIEAVVSAVRVMEDAGVFACGTGAELTGEGCVETDAALMAQDGRFGAVGAVGAVKNPILLAQAVFAETDHLLLCGTGAESFARTLGLAVHPGPSERARRRYERFLQEGSGLLPKASRRLGITGSDGAATEPGIGDSAGAVAMDRHGGLAVAVSGSGVVGRMAGRVGGAAVIGGGVFAAPSGAACFSGNSEETVRRLMAKDLVDRMATLPASVAMTLVMAEARRRKVLCGAVGMDARGGFCYGHTAPEMAWGYKIAERIFLFTEEKKRPT